MTTGLWWVKIALVWWLYGMVEANNGWFWHVTDFHYDFTYHGRQLSFNSDVQNPGQYGDYWCDAPWRLVNNSVYAMASIRPDVDFILWTGDTVLHGKDEDLSYQINSDILDNVTGALKSAFPQKPVYATFGNHDYYPTDQYPPHNNDLYNDTLLRWGDWIRKVSKNANFLKGGFYTIKTVHGMRIVALNTNLYYIRNKQVANESDPSGQLRWLSQTLHEAEQSKEKVIVTAHIPPGVHTPNGNLSMWERFNTKLVEILRKYSGVIVGMHFGHDHADEFKILPGTNGMPLVPVFMAPSVTPWRYKNPRKTGAAHNPGIRLVKYDKVTGKHLDLEQYYLDLPKANREGNAVWELEYKATDAYSVTDLTATSLQDLNRRMKNPKSDEFQKYWKYYTVSPPDILQEECDQVCHANIVCGFTNFHMNEFNRCVQEAISGGSKVYSRCSVFIFFILLLLWIFDC